MRSTHAPKACITGEACITHTVCITFRKERITQKNLICPSDKSGFFVGSPCWTWWAACGLTVRLDVCGTRPSPCPKGLRQQLPLTHAYVLHYYPVAVPDECPRRIRLRPSSTAATRSDRSSRPRRRSHRSPPAAGACLGYLLRSLSRYSDGR